MLIRRTDAVIENMDTWYHSGFHVYCGDAIRPDDEEGLERLSLYVIRTPISQERMLYIPASETARSISQVVYHASLFVGLYSSVFWK